MKLDDIEVVGEPLVLSTEAEVDDAESQLGIRFPGYREYVTRLGEGLMGGTYIRIYPARRILTGSNNLAEWRQRINQYWFWDEGRDILTKEQALECVIIGDTFDGDELKSTPNNFPFEVPQRWTLSRAAGPLPHGCGIPQSEALRTPPRSGSLPRFANLYAPVPSEKPGVAHTK